MRVLTEIRERLRALVFRRREDRELAAELRFHVEMAVEENLRRGMPPVEARRQAMLRLGGVTQVQEETRDARGLRLLERLSQDVRYGLRGGRTQRSGHDRRRRHGQLSRGRGRLVVARTPHTPD
jgi:hypothetical protein